MSVAVSVVSAMTPALMTIGARMPAAWVWPLPLLESN